MLSFRCAVPGFIVAPGQVTPTKRGLTRQSSLFVSILGIGFNCVPSRFLPVWRLLSSPFSLVRALTMRSSRYRGSPPATVICALSGSFDGIADSMILSTIFPDIVAVDLSFNAPSFRRLASLA